MAEKFTQFSVSWDMFCNAMIVLQDGTALIDGGTIQYDPFYGQPLADIFNPATNAFTSAPSMAHGRWYPTTTTLSDGRVMTFSGTNEDGNTNTSVEIYTIGSGWSQQYQAGWTPPLYPRMHLLPDGNVFYSGPGTSSALFNPSNTSWTLNVAHTNYGGTRTYGTSVLLPLTPANNYDPIVTIMGGNSPATNTTELIDMGAESPKWVYGLDMSEARIEMNAVILADGRILAVGGSVNDEDTDSLSLKADLFDLRKVNLNTNPPNLGTVSSALSNATERLYHSVALLLPDATVWLAGGNPERGTYNNTIEIYQPPYLFNSERRVGGTAYNHQRAEFHHIWRRVHGANPECVQYFLGVSGSQRDSDARFRHGPALGGPSLHGRIGVVDYYCSSQWRHCAAGILHAVHFEQLWCALSCADGAASAGRGD